jgi:hypothetical protein
MFACVRSIRRIFIGKWFSASNVFSSRIKDAVIRKVGEDEKDCVSDAELADKVETVAMAWSGLGCPRLVIPVCRSRAQGSQEPGRSRKSKKGARRVHSRPCRGKGEHESDSRQPDSRTTKHKATCSASSGQTRHPGRSYSVHPSAFHKYKRGIRRCPRGRIKQG